MITHSHSDKEQKKSFTDVDYYHLVTRNLFPVAASGVIDRAIFHPMETVITYKQNSGNSAISIVKSLLSQGVKKFYPGYFSNILAAIPIRMSIFSTYAFVKEQGKYTDASPATIKLFGGVFSGVLEATILCPVDSYRTRKTLPETAHLQFKPSLMFKGFLPLVLRTSSENTICLAGSDFVLDQMPYSVKQQAYAPYISGFVAGYASQLVSTPFDVIKTRRMREPDKSLMTSLRALIKEGGLFRSTTLKASRAGICNAMMIGTSSFIKNVIDEYENPNMKYRK